jgi:hypothetical protein
VAVEEDGRAIGSEAGEVEEERMSAGAEQLSVGVEVRTEVVLALPMLVAEEGEAPAPWGEKGSIPTRRRWRLTICGPAEAAAASCRAVPVAGPWPAYQMKTAVAGDRRRCWIYATS